MKSLAIFSIRAGNLDPEMIDTAVFESLNGIGSMHDVRSALYFTLCRSLPALENNLRAHASAGHTAKVQFLSERIDHYRTCIDLLSAGDIVTFIGRGARNKDVHVEIPAGEPLTQKESTAVQSATEASMIAFTQEPVPPAKPAPSADASVLPALALAGHATITRHKSKLMAALPRGMQLWILKKRHRSLQRHSQRS